VTVSKRGCGAKGRSFERELVNFMRDGEIPARRTQQSGGGQEKGDVVLTSARLLRDLTGECKRRAKLPAMFAHLGDHDFLAFREDRGETLVVLRLSTLRDLMQPGGE
jgi:Holliday junction resolvase